MVLTRQAGPVFYARIVLRLPGGGLSSIDSRPSDALALALQLSAPLFVASSILQVGGSCWLSCACCLALQHAATWQREHAICMRQWRGCSSCRAAAAC